jgi:hypothetical protein
VPALLKERPPITVDFEFSAVGFTSNTRVRVRDLFKGQGVGVFSVSFQRLWCR